MNLQGERLVAASPEATWSALNDPAVLQACIAGCESLERVSDNEYLASVALRIGPVNARFKGRLKLENVVPPTSYTIVFDGQGGVAGFGKGSADVRLVPDGAATRLAYTARAQVGGKLAQVGSRLIDGTAAKLADDFFAAFDARVGAPSAGAPSAGEQEATADGPAGAAAGAPPRAPAANGLSASARRALWLAAAALAIMLAAWLLG